MKKPDSLAVLRKILEKVDVLIDPYRPGTLESLGLHPVELQSNNARLIVARLSGFRRDGPYKDMAGHDINYLAVSGILSQLGRKNQPPYAPANIIADFAGGGLMCVVGILLALMKRQHTGRGQIVESSMVDGSAYLGSFMRFAMKTPVWDKTRGENELDGGCPWYDVYECRDGGFVAVGSLEERFYNVLMKSLDMDQGLKDARYDRRRWPELKEAMKIKFKEKSRAEWERIFNGTDACCTPILSQSELESADSVQRLPVSLSEANIGPYTHEETWHGKPLKPGHGGTEILEAWLSWRDGREYNATADGLTVISSAKL